MNINQISQTSSLSGTGMDLAQGLNSPQSCIDAFTDVHSSTAKDILHSKSGSCNFWIALALHSVDMLLVCSLQPGIPFAHELPFTSLRLELDMMFSIKIVSTLYYMIFAKALFYDLCTKSWPSMHSILYTPIYDFYGKSCQ